MARYSRMKPADRAVALPEDAPPEPTLEAASAFMRRAAQTKLPEPGADLAERMAVLTGITIRHPDPEVAEQAVLVAAKVVCMIEFTCKSTDLKTCSELARHFGWAAVEGVVDAKTALKRRVVDERLALKGELKPRALRQVRCVLYTAGRLFHPREYPAARVLPAPRIKQKAASYREIGDLYRASREMPAPLGMRALTLADLSYGVGARPADFKELRGTAITTVRSNGRAICVVALPNNSGVSRGWL